MIKLLNRVARIKARSLRLNFYINILQLAFLISIRGWAWWYIFLPPITLLLYWFESKIGIPGEMDVSWSASKQWQGFLIDFKEVKKKIETL